MGVIPVGTVWGNGKETAYVVKYSKTIECLLINEKNEMRIGAYTDRRFLHDFLYIGRSKVKSLKPIFQTIKTISIK
jgi:hypothetical protein